MGWNYRRRVRVGKNSWVNLSKRGASFSYRAGPVTFNSRGRRSVRIAPGLSYRGSSTGCLLMLVVGLGTITTIALLLGHAVAST